MKLTKQQLNFFHTFGYLACPAVFSPNEIAWITEEFECSLQEFGGGKNHGGSSRTMFGGPIEHRPRLCALLDDSRILGILGGILGEDFNYATAMEITILEIPAGIRTEVGGNYFRRS